MTREERLRYWQGIINKQKESDLCGAAFCKEHNINAGRFYYWRRRLSDGNDFNEGEGGFLDLIPCGSAKLPEELMREAVARDILVAEVRAWARRVGVEDRIKEIHIRPMKRKWASISTRGRLTLNVDLFTQPNLKWTPCQDHFLLFLSYNHP